MYKSTFRKYLTIPLHDYIKNSPRHSYWKKIEKTQYSTEITLKDIQWLRLQNILKHAYNKNEYYNQLFTRAKINPSDIDSYEDIKKIPLLTKDTIRNVGIKMISKGYDINQLMICKTGGSTGTALDIYITEECSEMRNACALRHNRWTGWDIGEPIAAVWGNPVIDTTLKGKIKNALLNPCIYLDTMKMNPSTVREFAKDWERVRPTMLYGHAHSLYILAKYVRELEIYNITPKGILSTSMMLISHEREFIENVFKMKIYDRYGCEEVGLIASECEMHEGMHINIEHLYVEIISHDDIISGNGSMGEIVVTDLMNEAMPLIRYRIGDVGILSNKVCSCGRGMPLLSRVIGRTADFLIKKDGTRISVVSIIENTLTKIEGIKQMQIIQKSIDSIIIKIVKDCKYSKYTERLLAEYIEKIFDHNVNIVIDQVIDIPKEKSGKYRFSICEMNDELH